MEVVHVSGWLRRDERRLRLLREFSQPLTAHQLARQHGARRSGCSAVLRELARHGLMECLNPEARRSRVYGLTPKGVALQQRLRDQAGLRPFPEAPAVDWSLYGWVCYSHRGAVLRVLDEPLQPSAIKRKARYYEPGIRMSANNVRDVIKLFVEQGIVRPVRSPGRARPRYELTRRGHALQGLLLAAETRIQYNEVTRRDGQRSGAA